MRRQLRLPSAGGDDSIIMMLSLKLLLLAFFILLVVLADFEDRRTRAVIESLQETFRGTIPAVRNLPIPEAALGQLDTSQTMVDEIAELFQESLPLVEVSDHGRGRRLRLELPASALFVLEESQLIAARGPLLQRLAGLLGNEEAAHGGFELQFIQGVAATAGELGKDSLPVLRAGVFARAMEEFGVSGERMAVTLSSALPADRLALEIRLYDEGEPAAVIPPAAAGAGENP